MNHRNGYGNREGRFKRPFSDRPQRPRREPARSEVETLEQPVAPDDSVTGCERRYLESLMATATPLVIVLQQGDQIVGHLAWYDHTCIKVRPTDGSPGLLIPKASIKYIYEELSEEVMA